MATYSSHSRSSVSVNSSGTRVSFVNGHVSVGGDTHYVTVEHAAGAQPSSAMLRPGIDLTGARLDGRDLHDQNGVGATLAGAHLTRANLRGARLVGANLAGAKLEGADLTNASLVGADFTAADARGARFNGAHVTGATFSGTHLEGADLRNARGLSDSQLADAITDTSTLR